MRKSMVSLVFMIMTGCLTDGAGDLKRMVQTNEPPLAFPREWEELSDNDVKRKLDKMIAWGRLREVKELARAPIEDRYSRQGQIVALAAQCVAERVRKDQVIGLCREFEFDGPAWDSAFSELYRCERKEAVAYLREIAASHGPKGRYHVYCHCAWWRWDDMVEMARSELAQREEMGTSEAIVIANVRPTSIAGYAKGYLIELGLEKGKSCWGWYGSPQE